MMNSIKSFFTICTILMLAIHVNAKTNPAEDQEAYDNLNRDLQVISLPELMMVNSGQPVSLGMLADVQVNDLELSRRLNEVRISDSVLDAETQVLKGQQIAVGIRKILSYGDFARLQFRIPETLKLKGQKNFISEKLFHNQVALAIRDKCFECQVQIQELRVPESNLKSEEILNYSLDTSGLTTAGSFLVPLKIETSRGSQKQWVSGRVSLVKQAAVAKRILKMNDRVVTDDFEIRKINVTNFRDGVADVDKLVGKVLSRPLTQGQAIMASDLKKELGAERGQQIKIILSSGDLEVSTSGEAQESGVLGDLVKVKTSDTKKVLTGKVVETGVVRVE